VKAIKIEGKWAVDMISTINKVKWSEGLIGNVKEKSEVKWNGERFFRAVKGFIILEISFEIAELYYV